MDKKNIISNYNLEQYNKKYRNRRDRLVKYTKQQVEDFDKKYSHYIYNNKTYSLELNNYLLKNRKWVLIDDTYYEIPKPIRLTWFRNLNIGVQAAACLVGIGAVTSSVVFPTLAVTVWNKPADNTIELKNYNAEGTKCTWTGSIEKDKKYSVKCDCSGFDDRAFGDKIKPTFFVSADGGNKPSTDKYALDSSVSVKVGEKILTKDENTITTAEELKALQTNHFAFLRYEDIYNNYVIGPSTLVKKENVTFTFTCNLSLSTCTIGMTFLAE